MHVSDSVREQGHCLVNAFEVRQLGENHMIEKVPSVHFEARFEKYRHWKPLCKNAQQYFFM